MKLDEANDLASESAVLGDITFEVELMMRWFECLEYCLFFLGTLLLQPFLDFFAQFPIKQFEIFKITYLLDVVAVCSLSFFFNQTYLILAKTRQDDGSLEF